MFEIFVFWVALGLAILHFLIPPGLRVSLTTSHSVIQPVVASTLQCAPELWVNRLPDAESQGGCPDRGRVREERPGERAGLQADAAVAEGAERGAVGEPGGVRLERAPLRKGLEGCGQESGLTLKSGGDT